MSKSGIPWYTYTYWRHYKHPISSRHRSNRIIDTLHSTLNPRKKTAAWYVFASVLVAIVGIYLLIQIISAYSTMILCLFLFVLLVEQALITAAVTERKKEKRRRKKSNT